MSKPYKGVTCADGVQGSVPTQAFVDNVDALMDGLGASAKCKQMARNQASELSMSAKASIPFASVSAQMSGSHQEQEMAQEGCGSVFMDSQTILNAVRNMNCTLNSVENYSDTVVNAGASVTIKVIPRSEIEKAGIRDLIRDQTLLLQVIEDNVGRKLVLEAIKELTRLLTSNNTFDGVTIRASANTNVKNVSNVSSEVEQKLLEEATSIATAAAENQVKKKMRNNALDSNVKAALQKRVEQKSESVGNNITSALNETKLKVDGVSGIVLEVPQSITMKDTVLDATTQLTVATAAMAKSAMDLGKEVANQYIADLFSGNTEELESEGVDPVAQMDAIKKGQAAVMNALHADHPMMLAAAGAAVLLFLFGFGRLGRGDGGGFQQQTSLGNTWWLRSILSGRSYGLAKSITRHLRNGDAVQNTRTRQVGRIFNVDGTGAWSDRIVVDVNGGARTSWPRAVVAPAGQQRLTYVPTSGLNYARLVLAVGLLVVNLSAMLALSCTTPLASRARDLASYAYGWAVTLSSVSIAAAALLLALNFLPATRAVAPVGIGTSVGLLVVSAVAVAYAAPTRNAIQDDTCDTTKDREVAWRTTGGLAALGALQTFFVFL